MKYTHFFIFKSMECIEILLEDLQYLYYFIDLEYNNIDLLKSFDLYPCIWEYHNIVYYLIKHFHNQPIYVFKDPYKDSKKIKYASLKFQLKNVIDCFDNHISNDYVSDIRIFLYVFMKFELMICTRKLLYNHSLIKLDSNSYVFESNRIEFINGVSKYCITNRQYVEFICNNGYDNEHLWSRDGWNYIQTNRISKPLYDIENDQYPIVHLSYYEAEAFASWKNCRLPTMDEWEKLASNDYSTLYPWGNDVLSNNKQFYPVDHVTNQNQNGIVGLVGNCWEWTQSSSYTSNVKGGSWITPLILCHYKYNNIQHKSTRIHFIGFRLVQN